MDNLIKIAEIEAESAESAKHIAETLASGGFVIASHEDVCFQNRFDVLIKSK